MICSMCGGRTGSYASNESRVTSRALTQLTQDLGPTCFCRAKVTQIEDLIQYSEERLDELARKYFPEARSRDDIREEASALPRNSPLRNIVIKRLEYVDLLERKLREKLKDDDGDGRDSDAYIPGQKKKVDILDAPPSDEGGSLSQWIKDMS